MNNESMARELMAMALEAHARGYRSDAILLERAAYLLTAM